MKREKIEVCGITSLVWGIDTNKVYLYIHGQGGNKEEAASFANLVGPNGWQVISIDLPEHGERKGEKDCFDPWHAVSELQSVMEYVKKRWTRVALFANSIGAWFSMLGFPNEKIEKCMFVSPLLDMQKLITTKMNAENISETQLEREKIIPIPFGPPLSWEYFIYVKEHPIIKWNVPTKILYGAQDDLTDRTTVDEFVQRFDCCLTVMDEGVHWFHTPEQLEVLKQWVLAEEKGSADR